ncbi:MAG: DUF481 domain-containing protein [Planctomycetes bacterium]|nr:DUF481 domain-containing protein [Planctomycetota bacterium]
MSIHKGKLTFESKLLGSLTVGFSQIHAIVTDEMIDILLLQQGKPIQARIESTGEGYLLVTADQRNPIEPNDIVAAGKAVQTVIDGPDKGFKWTGDMELGVSGRSGNTERLATSGKAKIEIANTDWTITGYFSAIYAKQKKNGRNTPTDDEIKGGGRVQRMLFDGISAYGKLDLERDKIEKINLRTVGDVGMGIRWFKTEDFFYENRLGLGFQQKEFDVGGRTCSTIAELTSDLRYKVNSHIDITQETSWIPDFNRQAGWRLRSESAATIYLDESHRWFIKSGLVHDYDNQPLQGVERLDTYYFTNLGIKF